MDTIFMELVNRIEEYRTYVLSGLLVVGLGAAALYYNRITNSQNEQLAYEAVALLLADVDSAYENPDLWSEVETGGRTALIQFKKSSAQPYLKIIVSEALWQQNNTEEALAMLEQGCQQLPTDSSFFGALFRTKAAALQMASADEAVRQKGVAQLEALSTDKKNIHRTYAQFLLANHFEQEGREAQAQQLYKQLAETIKGKPELEVSPFALMARHRLNQGV